MEKWKKRDLEIHFFGNGHNAIATAEMAEMLDVKNVKFCGFASNVEEIWRNYHGLIPASRHEGLPLALVEAMLCGRPSIVSRTGGNDEVVEDNIHGFLAASPMIQAIDDAMERAWARRHEWEKIGTAAQAHIRAKVPENPSALFTAKLAAIHRDVTASRHP